MFIRDSSFSNCKSKARGGAINILPSRKSTLIENSDFINNYAFAGGAIASETADIVFRNCSFINNSASIGGAFW